MAKNDNDVRRLACSPQHMQATFGLERMWAAQRRGSCEQARAHWEMVRAALKDRPAWEIAAMERARGLR